MLRLAADDAGSASLEFITTGVILLVPLVYLVLVMAAVQGGALAVEGAARQAARVYVAEDDQAAAGESARVAVAVALADYGVDPATSALEIVCRPRPTDCLARQGWVSVTVRIGVVLPLVPQVLDLAVPLEVQMEATATRPVSRFRGAG
ncbi:MAG: hypothetical protein H7146_01635 [Burkholderiaceae bacterium]|nr:hypothetical protein [Microbacteriaceae bacterium]